MFKNSRRHDSSARHSNSVLVKSTNSLTPGAESIKIFGPIRHLFQKVQTRSSSVLDRKQLRNLGGMILEELVAHFCGALESSLVVETAVCCGYGGGRCRKFSSWRSRRHRVLVMSSTNQTVRKHAPQHVVESIGGLVAIGLKPFDAEGANGPRESEHLRTNVCSSHRQSTTILLLAVDDNFIDFLKGKNNDH